MGQKRRCVVRVSDSFWYGNGSVHYKRTIRTLQRQSNGTDYIKEFVCDPKDYMCSITNLFEVSPGIYELSPCNESYDWETGVADDWDYVLKTVE